jgi:hypothetical protein
MAGTAKGSEGRLELLNHWTADKASCLQGSSKCVGQLLFELNVRCYQI